MRRVLLVSRVVSLRDVPAAPEAIPSYDKTPNLPQPSSSNRTRRPPQLPARVARLSQAFRPRR